MRKETHRGAKGPLIPILLLVFVLLLFGSIYQSLEIQSAGWVVELFFVILLVIAIYNILRYFFPSFDYMLLEDELIIHRNAFKKRDRVFALDLRHIECVYPHMHVSGARYNMLPTENYCATLRGRAFMWHVVYTEKNELKRIIFEPSPEFIEELKPNLGEKLVTADRGQIRDEK